jgi:hypothetical protein
MVSYPVIEILNDLENYIVNNSANVNKFNDNQDKIRNKINEIINLLNQYASNKLEKNLSNITATGKNIIVGYLIDWWNSRFFVNPYKDDPQAFYDNSDEVLVINGQGTITLNRGWYLILIANTSNNYIVRTIKEQEYDGVPISIIKGNPNVNFQNTSTQEQNYNWNNQDTYMCFIHTYTDDFKASIMYKVNNEMKFRKLKS